MKRILISFLSFFLSCTAFFEAHAVTFTVTNTDNGGAGSLRQAIFDSNAVGGSNTIEFQVSGTIALGSNLPTITQDVVFTSSTGNPVLITGGRLVVNADAAVSTQDFSFSSNNELRVGDSTTGTLLIQNGADISDTEGTLGNGNGSNGTATVTGAGSTWTNTVELKVGDEGTGTLNIQNGGQVIDAKGTIGNKASSTGSSATVSGAGSTWTHNGEFAVGDAGNGTLTIEAGGTVSDTDGTIANEATSTSSAIVTGSGSAWTHTGKLKVGDFGVGELQILDGATVTDVQGTIGDEDGSVSTATVSGAGSTWTTNAGPGENDGNFKVGNRGTGTLYILNGGRVVSVFGTVGDEDPSHSSAATVDGAGSSWENSVQLDVADSGTGTLTISSGGAVSDDHGNIGNELGSVGAVTVTGAGSTWTHATRLDVGEAGTGTLTIKNGGEVSVGSGASVLYVSSEAGGQGTVNLGSGAGTTAGTITASEIQGGLGTTGVLNFDHDNAAAYTFSTPITLNIEVEQKGPGTTILTGANTYTGGTTISAGTLRAGHTSALGTGDVTNNATLDVGTTALNIGGDYSQTGSVLKLSANSASDFGSLLVTGTAVVTGAVIDVTLGGYLANNAALAVVTSVGGLTYNTTTINVIGDARTTLTASVSGNVLTLTASRAAGGFASSVTGGGNSAVAGGVLDEVSDPTDDMTSVLNTLNSLGDSQVAASLDTTTPDVDRGVLQTTTTTLNNFVSLAMNRTEGLLGGTGVSSGDAAQATGLWAKEYGSYLTQGERNNVSGYDAWNAGTAIGVDHQVAENLVLGVSGGYALGGINGDADNAETDLKSAQMTLYGGYQDPGSPFFLDAAGSLAHNWYEGQRDVNIGGSILRTASSDYDGQQYGLYLGSGYRIKLSEALEWTPLASLQWTRLDLDGYTETGAGALNLNVDGQQYDQLQSGLGMRLSSLRKYTWGTLTPEIHAKWLYDFTGDPVSVTARFEGGGASFQASGAKPERNSFNIGGQMKLGLKNDISIVGACDAEIKDEFLGIYGSFMLRRDF